jgi:hypothetical protein
MELSILCQKDIVLCILDKELLTFYSSNERIPNLYEKCLVKDIRKESFSNKQYKTIYGDESMVEYTEDTSKEDCVKVNDGKVLDSFDFAQKPGFTYNGLQAHMTQVEKNFRNFDLHLKGLREMIEACIHGLKTMK